MTAQEFWNNFKAIFEDENKKTTAIEKWHSYSEYTKFILDELESILSTDKLDPSREYYRIDLIGYKDKRNGETLLIPDYKFKNYKWDLEIAIEHENSSYNWLDEIIKLLHINCPLRIVIGYIPIIQKENHARYFDAILKNISNLNAYKTLQDNAFLIIIGDSECGSDKRKFCHYTAYVFDKNAGQFAKIGEF